MKKKHIYPVVVLSTFAVLAGLMAPAAVYAKRPMEYLDRALVAMEVRNAVYLSWRMLGTDAPDIGFNLYRNGEKINVQPITESTNYTDAKGTVNDKYRVEAILPDGSLEHSDEEISVWAYGKTVSGAPGSAPLRPYKTIPLPEPPEGENLIPGDMSVGDLTGNGKYELIYMWEGVGPYLDAIDLDGKHLWRISLGVNVTANAAPILVYDLTGDGKAEVACITGPGTKDGTGKLLSKGPAATIDHTKILKRKSSLMEDPAFITVFDGETGRELATTLFWPPLGPEEEMQKVWGDDRGHRSNSIKGAVLYHKDLGPLVVYSRGIYTRVAMGAYTFDGKELKQVWTFDSDDPSGKYRGYRSQGNHSVAVGDVDGDGSDELMYGACAIDHDGKGLYTTGMGHGDSHALGDLDPDHPGLEYYQGHEGAPYGVSMRAAGTGKILWEVRNNGDVGRAWAADVDPNYRGAECVAVGMPNWDSKGNVIPTNYNAYSQPIYFDGRPQRALRGGSSINGEGGRILTGWYYGAATSHGSKNDAMLIADILGDWREEAIFLRSDKRALIMFSTWIPTKRKNPTLMHDPTYRMNVAVQNVGYNQPAHVGYYFADGAPVHDIELIRHGETKKKD